MGGDVIRSLWRTVLTPSERDEDAYLWALILIGHAMLGAALGDALGPAAAVARLGIAAAYWCAKERGDLRRGGGLRDGIVDALAVGAGVYLPERGVALMVLATACIGAWIKEMRDVD